MAVSQYYCPLSPNLLDNLRDGLAELSRHYYHACILDSCALENEIFSTDNQPYSLLAGFVLQKSEYPGKCFSENSPRDPKRWYFGHLNYELKDMCEPQLASKGHPESVFPGEIFFEADIVFVVQNNQLKVETFEGTNPGLLLQKVLNLKSSSFASTDINVESITLSAYLEKASRIRSHILRGNVYELNYCIPFYGRQSDLNIPALWRAMNQYNPAPFSALYKYAESWLCCASPERFLKRSNNTLYSQPIKGTIRRGKNEVEDRNNASILSSSEKERSENIMITDLVRNDLARIAKRGSVKVEELCGLYAFRHVFQLVTTVSAEQEDGITLKQLLRALFPMGSMTGAPKFRAMQLIEEYEEFRRELFSGSVGYIAPGGDFDLNVVIRSILYNAVDGRIIIPAGSALTAKSDLVKEYEECQLKAQALINLLQKKQEV